MLAPRDNGTGPGRLPDLAHVILGHVGMHPEGVHGYQLGRILSGLLPGVPPLPLGQVYRVLRRLQRAGLVNCRVEADSSRLRYRFTITCRGEACLREWLTKLPLGTGATCQHLLERLQFAERVPGIALLRMVDEAIRECGDEVEVPDRPPNGGRTFLNPYQMALKARLAADRRWLEEVRRILEGQVVDCVKAAGA